MGIGFGIGPVRKLPCFLFGDSASLLPFFLRFAVCEEVAVRQGVQGV